MNAARRNPVETYNIGDMVKYYAPPSAAARVSAGRKDKHLYRWRGPARVIRRLSPSGYLLEEVETQRQVSRTSINIRPYYARDGIPGLPTVDDDDFEAGELIACVDDEYAKLYGLARILSVTTENINVHYYGTTNEDLAKARFLPVSISGGGYILGDKRGKRARDSTGTIALADAADLIKMRHVKLRAAGRLTAASLKSLRRLRGFRHIYLERAGSAK